MTDQEPDVNPGGGGSTALVAVVGVVIGLAIAAGVIWYSNSDDPGHGVGDGTEATTPTTEPTIDGSEAESVVAFDPVDLVVAYGRSRTEDHALIGELRRPGQDSLPVRRAIRADREIDEVGDTAAVTEAGETRQCERIEGEWLCTPPLPRVGTDIDVQGFASLLLTDDPPYSIFAVANEPPADLASIAELGPSTCWSMVSAGRRDRARFGAETTMCFHDELGALIGRVTETSGGNDVFVATDLRAEVTVADVEPSR